MLKITGLPCDRGSKDEVLTLTTGHSAFEGALSEGEVFAGAQDPGRRGGDILTCDRGGRYGCRSFAYVLLCLSGYKCTK